MPNLLSIAHVFSYVFNRFFIFKIDVKTQNVFVLRDGPAFTVSLKNAIHDVTFMDNAKMAHACVFQVGMVSTVLSKAAPMNAVPPQKQEQADMESVKELLVLVLIPMVICGRVSVTMDGKE